MLLSPTVQAFWLKKRKRDEWSEVKEFIVDTKAQEEERKKLFLNMINGEVVNGATVKVPLRTLNRHGLIAGATGSGKTFTAITSIYRLLKFSKAKFRQ